MNSFREINEFADMEDTFNELHNFVYNSNNNHKLFNYFQLTTGQLLELQQISKLRWFGIKGAIKNYMELWEKTLVPFLQTMGTDKANKLLTKITNVQFVFLVYWCYDMIDVLNPISEKCQSDSQLGMEIPELINTMSTKVCYFVLYVHDVCFGVFNFFFFDHKNIKKKIMFFSDGLVSSNTHKTTLLGQNIFNI